MTVIPLPITNRISVGSPPHTETAGWAEPRHLATNAAGLVHHETAPLLGALEDAVATAAARGVNDTGARRAADDLRRARIALDFAITAAGRALADREVRIRRAS
jgi:hypothetical protein